MTKGYLEKICKTYIEMTNCSISLQDLMYNIALHFGKFRCRFDKLTLHQICIYFHKKVDNSLTENEIYDKLVEILHPRKEGDCICGNCQCQSHLEDFDTGFCFECGADDWQYAPNFDRQV